MALLLVHYKNFKSSEYSPAEESGSLPSQLSQLSNQSSLVNDSDESGHSSGSTVLLARESSNSNSQMQRSGSNDKQTVSFQSRLSLMQFGLEPPREQDTDGVPFFGLKKRITMVEPETTVDPFDCLAAESRKQMPHKSLSRSLQFPLANGPDAHQLD